MIIVDTGFWIALANRQDQHHHQATQILDTIQEPLITTWCVVTETCYLLLTRISPISQELFLDNIVTGGFELFDFQALHIRRMKQLVAQYSNFPMDLADASLVTLAEDLGHGNILTSDCRDFSIYRWNETNQFNNLFLDYP
ncbi:MAG: PIN domain-containing protein [Kamptonema sp. SIO4C4]|nr:PIN domain-containing protein [Kamptonema sp. SIO4C4]